MLKRKICLLCLTYFVCGSLIVKQVCHRDLKLENTLLDGSTAPRLKICDFGYSKVKISVRLLRSRQLEFSKQKTIHTFKYPPLFFQNIQLPYITKLLACCIFSHRFCIHNQSRLLELLHTLLLKCYTRRNTTARYIFLTQHSLSSCLFQFHTE